VNIEVLRYEHRHGSDVMTWVGDTDEKPRDAAIARVDWEGEGSNEDDPEDYRDDEFMSHVNSLREGKVVEGFSGHLYVLRMTLEPVPEVENIDFTRCIPEFMNTLRFAREEGLADELQSRLDFLSARGEPARFYADKEDHCYSYSLYRKGADKPWLVGGMIWRPEDRNWTLHS
jgi:hypothetical protein